MTITIKIKKKPAYQYRTGSTGMITNTRFSLTRSQVGTIDNLPEAVGRELNEYPLRWYVSHVGGDEITIEATTYTDGKVDLDSQRYPYPDPTKTAIINLIPTGIGCSIGGYAGDAAPVTNLLGSVADYVITNPNALNASNFISKRNNVLYTDGHSIDLFSQGHNELILPYQNKLGVIIERTDDESLDHLFNIINAVRAIHGVQIVDCVVTERPIGSRCERRVSGAYSALWRILMSSCLPAKH